MTQLLPPSATTCDGRPRNDQEMFLVNISTFSVCPVILDNIEADILYT